MADKTIILSKDPSQLCQEIPLIEGDNNTYVIRFVAPRYSGGVDLADLTWGVNIKNATLEQGFVNLSSATSDDSAVYIDWNVGAFATVLHGPSFCTIEGRNNSSSIHPVWKSSIVTLRVGRAISADDIIDGSNVDSITEIAENVAESIVANSVRYDTSQSLNSTQKTTARTNIGAVSQDEVDQAIATEATAREAADDELKSATKTQENALYNAIYGTNAIPTARRQYIINSSSVWASVSSDHICIPIKAGDNISVTANNNASSAYIAFLKDDTIMIGSAPAFADGETGRLSIARGTTGTYIAPQNSNYLYIAYSSGNGTTLFFPNSIKINGVENLLNVVNYFSGKISEINGTISEISDTVDDMADDITSMDGRADALEAETAKFAEVIKSDYEQIALENIPDVTKLVGYNSSVNSNPVSVFTQSFAGYDTYYFYLAAGNSVYFPDSTQANYISISIGENPTGEWYEYSGKQLMNCDTATRYRKSDSNLPVDGSAVTLNDRAIIVVTVTTGANVAIAIKRLMVSRDAIEPDPYAPRYRYVSGAGLDASIERLEILLPTKSGLLKYNFVHTVSAEKNADVWRLSNVCKSDSSFADGGTIITQGEWECALKISGRDDFCGGFLHGDEKVQSIVMLVDGAEKAINSAASFGTFERIEILQRTNLYDPADNTTIVAEHGSAHVFTRNGVSIRQSVIWAGEYTLSDCYLAMLPAAQSAFSKVFADKTYEVETPGNTAIAVTPIVKSGTVFGNGCTAEMAIAEFPEGLTPCCGQFQCQTNGGTTYYKMYFAVCKNSEAYNCTSGEQWRARTEYRITM